jgi:uncharacterized damage-inducible protein DinB
MLNDLHVLFDECEEQRKQLLEAAASLDASQLAYRPREGVWSLAEELHHLVLVDQEIVRRASRPEEMADLIREFRRQKRGVPFWLVRLILRLDIRVPVPVDSVLPRPDQSLSTLATQWEQARKQMRCLLEAVDDARLPFVVHPVCGPFTPAQTLRFLLIHGQYHQRHMHRVRSSRTFPRR